MARYILVTSHEAGDCVKALVSLRQAGSHYITHSEWGCEDGVHTGWMFIEAETDEEAQLQVPPIERSTASLVKLNAFTHQQIQDFHERELKGEDVVGGSKA